MFRELKEDIGKVKKMKYEQNSNISKETENLRKRQRQILKLKNTITQILKFTRDIKKQILAGKRNNQ